MSIVFNGCSISSINNDILIYAFSHIYNTWNIKHLNWKSMNKESEIIPKAHTIFGMCNFLLPTFLTKYSNVKKKNAMIKVIDSNNNNNKVENKIEIKWKQKLHIKHFFFEFFFFISVVVMYWAIEKNFFLVSSC